MIEQKSEQKSEQTTERDHELTDEQWQQKLTQEQYLVCRKKHTERPFTGELLDNKSTGTYQCVCCDALLFHSDSKFDSGCGWPSFFEAADDTCIRYITDDSLGMQRIEIVCAQCDSHLGHVFDDGPAPTGKRYCLNSVALRFLDK